MGRSKKMEMREPEKWIQGAVKHPGALHRALHVPMDKKIPETKLNKALHSKSPLMRERANFANNVKRFNRSR